VRQRLSEILIGAECTANLVQYDFARVTATNVTIASINGATDCCNPGAREIQFFEAGEGMHCYPERTAFWDDSPCEDDRQCLCRQDLALDNSWLTGLFADSSGACRISEDGRCVGRPDGYGPNERCSITIGREGALAECAVFDMQKRYEAGGTPSGDYITLPDGSTRNGADSLAGMELFPGQTIEWTSDTGCQGGCPGDPPNGCAA
jgi:hypothetical protein